MTNNTIHPNKSNVGTIYCVGRNYAAHAQELNNPIPKTPLIFTKVPSTIIAIDHQPQTLELPLSLGRCDHETELAIRIGADLYQATQQQAIAAISHYGLALDLTLREQQQKLKQQGHPWTLAKNFINATPMSPLFAVTDHIEWQNLSFSLTINGQTQQQANSKNMLFSIAELIVFISNNVPLQAGDIILTGTPEGVGPLNDQDQISLYLFEQLIAQASIKRN